MTRKKTRFLTVGLAALAFLAAAIFAVLRGMPASAADWDGTAADRHRGAPVQGHLRRRTERPGRFRDTEAPGRDLGVMNTVGVQQCAPFSVSFFPHDFV